MNLQYHFNELFHYVYHLKKDNFAEVDYEDLRKQVNDMIAKIKSRIGGVDAEEFQLALFAVCAWIDELVQNSTWKGVKQWQDLLLQTEYFDTTDAGDEFFSHLAKIPLKKTDLIRIYYRCMVLGFKGQHHQSVKLPELFRFKNYALEQLTDDHEFKDNVLGLTAFPEAYYKEAMLQKKPAQKRSTWKKIFWWLLPLPVLVVMYLFYYLVIHNTVTNYLELIK